MKLESGSIVIALIGLLMLVAGVAAWFGLWRSWVLFPFLFSPGATYIPAGLGFLVLAAAGFSGVRVLSDAGLGLLIMAAVMTVWQPAWSFPTWYRRSHRSDK